ncbi:hypothetical protein [Hyphomicrobium sp. 802]|uniref:hypothetical protein n=1 Tax=Hyphomicrobium sp. 802 TaxID=1112272 RepID=UPI00045EB7F6|nr:hypothetical protein [Hyphomicrobium sp. 802]
MSKIAPEKERLHQYLILMVELDTRINLVNAATSGKLNLSPPYARELCYFQFRRMCEIIALGCLILHGDIPATQSNNIRKEWNADKIMGLLSGLHENFFPQSVVRTGGDKTMTIEANAVQGALTRQEFKQLYSECGVVLHRGSIRSLQMETPPSQADYAKVFIWAEKIVKLMQEHIVTRSLVTGLYLVSMKTVAGGPQGSLLTFEDGKIAVESVTVKVVSH